MATAFDGGGGGKGFAKTQNEKLVIGASSHASLGPDGAKLSTRALWRPGHPT